MYVQPIDAVQLLLNQHRRVEALLRAIEHAGADERRQAFADAADELALHIGAEEAVFYPAVSRLTPGHAARSAGDICRSKRLLGRFAGAEAGSPRG